MRAFILLLFMLCGFAADNLKPLVLSSTNQPKNMTTGDSMWIAPYYGVDAAKPAAAAAPHCLYFATDTSRLYRSNGATWTTVAGGTIGVSQGGTGFSSYVVGDILYADTTSSLATRAIGANNAVMISNGTAPTWSTSLNLAGTIAASNLTGTNTGDQTITLTSDVTGSGTGSFATTIAANAVTNAKLAQVATATFKGRNTAGTGNSEDLTVAQAKTLLNLTGTNSGDQTITLTSDVTGSGTGSFATTIANSAVTTAKINNDAVTNTKLANMATNTFKGRTTAGSGDPEDLTATQATAMLNVVTSSLNGLAPSSGGGTTNFLRADGAWAAPGGGGITGTLVSGRVPYATGASSVTDSSAVLFSVAAGFETNRGTNASNLIIGRSAGNTTTTTTSSTIVGNFAGNSLTSGVRNTFMGSVAGNSLTTGSDNTFVGYGTGELNISDSGNSAFGAGALTQTVAANNTGVGKDAGTANTTGIDNTFLGASAGLDSLDGDNNLFVGADSGGLLVTGGTNTFLGAETQAESSSTDGAVAVGFQALSSDGAVAVGSQSTAEGDASIALGSGATTGPAAIGGMAFGTGTLNDAANSVIFGRSATANTANSFSVGSTTYPITDYLFGAGDFTTSAAPAITISPTHASGTNITGGAISLAGGRGTGTGVGGSVIIKTAPAGSSGTTLNALVSRVTVDQAGNLIVNTVGTGLQIKEGSNAKMGTANLVAGTVTVSTTAVTSTSRIFLTSQADGGTVGFQRVTARTAATSFTITSLSALDTSTIAWFIVEPSP